MIGRTISHYGILEKLSGDMGEIYRAAVARVSSPAHMKPDTLKPGL